MWRIALVLLLAVPAHADEDLRRETVARGQTIEREVGWAIGAFCDEDVVTVEMKNKNPDTNVVLFTGKREGKTFCRVGTDPERPTYLYEVTVTPKPTRAPKRP